MADKHPDKHQVRLGAVQETLFITLAARARETQRKHPVLRDPRAVELLQSIDYDTAKYGRSAGGFITVLRTAIIDFWVREFLSAHPADRGPVPRGADRAGHLPEADVRPAAQAGGQEGHRSPLGLGL